MPYLADFAIRMGCVISSVFDQTIVGGIMLGVFAVVLSLIGYRIAKVVAFFMGAMLGSIFLGAVSKAPEHMAVIFFILSGVGAVLIRYLDAFLFGAAWCALCGLEFFHSGSWLFILAAFGGILGVVYRKFMIILFTSWTGATVLAGIILYLLFIMDVKLARSPWDRGVAARNVFVVAQILFAVLGVCFQYKTAPVEKPIEETKGGPSQPNPMDDARPMQ